MFWSNQTRQNKRTHNTSLKARNPGIYGTCSRTTSNSSWTTSKVPASKTTSAAHAVEGSSFEKLMSTPPIYFRLPLLLALLWSEFEPIEGKFHPKSSSRMSLLFSMSCVLQHRKKPAWDVNWLLLIGEWFWGYTWPILVSAASTHNHLLLLKIVGYYPFLLCSSQACRILHSGPEIQKKKKTAANLKNSSCVLHQHNDLSWTVKFEHCGIAGRTDREENRRIGWRENSPRFSHLIRRRRPMPPPASLPSPLPLHRPPLLPATATPVLHLAGARLLVTVAALVMTAAAEPERRPSPARRRERCRGSQRDTETDRWGPQKRVDRSQSRPISLCPGNLRRMGHNCGPDMSYNGPLLRRTFPDGTV